MSEYRYPTDLTPVTVTPPFVDEAGNTHVGVDLTIPSNPGNPGLVVLGGVLGLVALGLIAYGSRPKPEPRTTVTVVPPPALPPPPMPTPSQTEIYWFE